MTPRIVLTGGHGFVAGSIIHHVPRAWETHVISRHPAPLEQPGLVWHATDPLAFDNLRRLLLDLEPNAVIHTAAIADIDYCEAHQNIARNVNTEFPIQIARACRELGAKLVFCSTDNVFDGERGLYGETDRPQAVNFYGKTKVAAEEEIARITENAVIARVALVMGLPLIGSGNSFLARWLPALKEGRTVGVPDNELRTPVDVVTLGKALLELSEYAFTGTIHLSGNDRLNRFEMAQRVAARLGYDPSLIVVNNPETIPGRAPRPRDVSLANEKARRVLQTPMVDLETGLDLVMAAASRPHL